MTGPYKVLVIEDDLYMQRILFQCLSSKFTINIFNNGLDGLAYLQAGNVPDIIIADYNTPVVNGIQVIEQVRSSGFFNSIPILMLSGEDDTETRIKCLEAGADDYLMKPFNPRELVARLRNLLKRTGKSASLHD
ncbi:MAG TPA: response regulator transcription factor [Chitinophagaceae bacterium]|jgi:DNA-binding response OmpR family regulator|nr:response regulator transcription factor [Chitinophagaceae bacterium]